MKSVKERREALYATISDNGPVEGNENLETSTCVGWVLVTEWMDGEGERWLNRIAGNAGGDNMVHWTANGLLHEALYGDWPD